MTDVISYDHLRQSVEAATGGLCTVIYDSKGYPNYMRVFPKCTIQSLLPDLGLTGTHPAFIVNGVEKSEIFISMYPATNILNTAAVALPGLDPANTVNFNEAVAACEAKGTGWHLMTNAEWSLVDAVCMSNGFIPHGNNNWGRDITYQYENGALTNTTKIPGSSAGNTHGRTCAGSGPVTWRHDNSPAGVADLVGNVAEWCSGFRLNNGEIQVIPNNDAAITGQDHSASSTAWKAILQDGTNVDPGTTNSLKFDSQNPDGSTPTNVGPAQLSTTIVNSVNTGFCQQAFKSLTAKSGVNVPPILRLLGIFPYSTLTSNDNIWIRNVGERLPYRGGYYSNGTQAGLWSMSLGNPRTNRLAHFGFRPAFYQ